MKQSYFDFDGKLLLEVRGEGGRSTEQFRTMYHHFEVSEPDRDPDMIVERTVEDISAESVLGHPHDHYGWNGERFFVRRDSEYMAVEPGWKHIYVTPDWEPFHAIYPVEFKIRQRALESDTALVHASGISLDGETTIFPAWRGAGKTNTLLSLLREGAGYMSDDRLWVSADRDVHGYPLSVNLQEYNLQSFPEIQQQPEEFRDIVRERLHRLIDSKVDRQRSTIDKGIDWLNGIYLENHDRSFTTVSELFPGAEYFDRSTLDNVVILQAAPDADHVRLERLSTEEAVSAVSAISFYEWNKLLEEFFRAYDALVPDGKMTEELQAVLDGEERVFRTLFERTENYRAWIPRESNWGATGTDREVVKAVESLRQKQAIKADD